jgi:diaminopimelate decarboxylase
LRLNPGFGHGHDPRVSTGGASSKHGIWHADFETSLAEARALGLSVVGLHVHIGSGSDLANLALAAHAFERCAPQVGSSLRSLSAGGGLPVPYRPGETQFDVASYTRAWCAARDRAGASIGRALELEVEPGRFLVAECGVLLARVLSTKRSGEYEFAIADAGFHTLLRPAMYGSYHHIEALSFQDSKLRPTVVAGPLCESGDVLTQSKTGQLLPRDLPALAAGDLLAIHDAGAYGMSMASRYNSQPLPAEVLVDGESSRLIRRRESIDDLLAHEIDR